jgi:hypothetical protein
MDCYCCFDALLLSLSLSLSLSEILLFGLCERVVLEYVRQARTACVAVGATRLSFADAIKLHNTVALRLLSLSLSLSLSVSLISSLQIHSLRGILSDVRRRIGDTQQRQKILYSIIFQKTRQGQNKTKKKLLRIFSLATFGMGIRSSISPDASTNQTQGGKREISSSRSTL